MMVLPSDVHKALVKVAVQQGLTVEQLVSRCFLLGFLSFDRDLYILEEGTYRKILFEEPET